MSFQREDEPGSPRQPLPEPEWTEPDVRSPVTRKMIKKFREQMHALGGLWILIGSLALVVAALALGGNAGFAQSLGGTEQLLLFLVLSLGAVWIALGVMTCLKQMWAVYVGLALSYLSLLAQVLRLNVCGIVILIVVILQAHRVIGWANQMKASGVPLTTKPN